MSGIEKVLSDVISAATSHRRTGISTALAMVAKENVRAVVIVANGSEAHRIKQEFCLNHLQVTSIHALSRLLGGRSLLLFDPHAVAALASCSLAEIDNLRSTLAHLLAHQQARALELAAERSRYSTALDTIVSLECDSDDLADTCGCASCRAHEALESSDELSEIAIRDTELATLRSENERKDAEIERLRGVLRSEAHLAALALASTSGFTRQSPPGEWSGITLDSHWPREDLRKLNTRLNAALGDEREGGAA